MILQVLADKSVSQDTSFLCNQYDNESASIVINLPALFINANYSYFILCKPPKDAGVNQYSIPLILNIDKLTFIVNSTLSQYIGNWQFAVVIKDTLGNLVALTDYFVGKVKSGIAEQDQLNEQIEDSNLKLLYAADLEAEALRVIAEDERKLNETARVASEETREGSENTREINETNREDNESDRIAAENIRVSNEDTRLSNEVIRQETEAARVTAEINRGIIFDQLVEDGVLQTNIEGRLTELETTYAPRLTTAEAQINTLDAELYVKTYTKPTKSVKNIVSFYFDDAPTQDYTVIKPIADAKGIPITIGVIAGLVGSGGQMTQAELLELQANGWEMQAHMMSNVDMRVLTEAEQDYQLRESKRVLKNMGFEIESTMYPRGFYNDTTMRLARKYYRAGFSSNIYGWVENKPPIKTFEIGRILIDAYDLTTLQSKIDAMNNQWYIFYSHSAGMTQANIDKFVALIDYVKGKNIEIMTCSKALDTFENVLDLGDDTSNKYFKIGADGTLKSKPFNGSAFAGDNSGIKNTTPITSFDKGKVTFASFNGAEASGIPFSSGVGTLITYRLHQDDSLNFQEFHTYNAMTIAKRTWNTTTGDWNTWQSFDRVTPLKKYTYADVPFGTIPANGNSTIDVTVTGLTTSGAVNITFLGEVPTGLITMVSVPSADTLRIKAYNLTASNLVVNSRGVYVTQIKP